MNGIGQIFKKEMDRVFKDKKMVFSVFILPAILMIGMLYLVGSLGQSMMNDVEEHVSIVYIMNEPSGFSSSFLEESNSKITPVKDAQHEKKVMQQIKDGTADLLISFPDGFEQDIAGYKPGGQVPQVKTYYNPSEDYSSAAYNHITMEVLEVYRQSLLAERIGDLDDISVFTVNSDNKDMVIQDEKKASGKALGTMLPYFITLLLFAGAMGIGTDMIAGEKERGTMASMLVSPVKRSSIVLGKVLALMSISGISSLVYVIAMAVAMPLISGAMTFGGEGGLNIQLDATQIVMLGALLVALAFLYSSIIVLISVFAKTIKEASTYVMPAYMAVLVVGLMTMFNTGNTETHYYIPLYNTALVLKGILSNEVTMAQYGITLGMTFGLGFILMGIIVKAFESEKVMSA